jgi:N-methylhydantoinase A
MKPQSDVCRIGIDVGGTFTDCVLFNARTGELTFFKEPSVPSDPSMAVQRGVNGLLLRAGVKPESVELVVHGTTLAVNAVIQRRGAKVGLVVSQGHRDVLEIGRCHMPNPYDFTAEREEPLVSREFVFEAPARVRADGKILNRPTTGEISAVAKALKASKVSSVAVMLLHSYRYPELEQEVAAGLRKELDGVLITESAQIWPERREYERTLVSVMNAYVHPLMDDYLRLLTERIAATGVKAPIYITASNGGTLSIETARERPIETILSGPASGVVAASQVAAAVGRKRLITFDMGGTSSDIALSKEGDPEYATRTQIGDFPLVLPVVNVSSIGAGGGSMVWVDAHGVLKVGPNSAGADPGPICYGRGGKVPTVTDCYLMVGYIDPDHFLGGRMRLDRDAVREALEKIGDKIGITGEDRAVRAAEAALRVATAVMATELQKGLAQRGEDPRTFALMAFGGAGPTHANLLAKEARLETVVIPRAPGTFCAMGALLSDVKRDYIRSVRLLLDNYAEANKVLEQTFRALEQQASTWIASEGALLGKTTFSVTADMRYQGQSWELPVAIPDVLRLKPDASQIAALFHKEHERVYAFHDLESPTEVTTLRLRVTGRMPPIVLPDLEKQNDAQPIAQRRVFHDNKYIDVSVFDRRKLGPNTVISGPAIIEQEDSTSWILEGWHATVDRIGNLNVTKQIAAKN